MAVRETLRELKGIASAWQPWERYGYIQRVVGLTLEARGPAVRVGQLCRLLSDDPSGVDVPAEVVGFNDRAILLLPLSEVHGLRAGTRLQVTPGTFEISLGPDLMGRVLDGLGRAIDEGPAPRAETRQTIYSTSPSPLSRQRVSEPLGVGIRAIDSLLTCGQGQRIGIFSGSGVGKSTLLGMIARGSSADVNVIGLIGERGREVRDFLEDDLGPEGLAKSIVVVATSDQPPLLRIKAAFVATTIAEYFRDLGNEVLLIMDSLTRFATAQREVGLATGEPPATRGFPPSVFSLLPRLLERSGNSDRGTMTAFYSVLVEGDDMDEPVADTVRGILDGHIVLSRALADEGHYPAIDVLRSVSRLMSDVADEPHRAAAAEFKRLLAAHEDARDLINIGAYQMGSDRLVDRSIEHREAMRAFLQQDLAKASSFARTRSDLIRLTRSEGEAM